MLEKSQIPPTPLWRPDENSDSTFFRLLSQYASQILDNVGRIHCKVGSGVAPGTTNISFTTVNAKPIGAITICPAAFSASRTTFFLQVYFFLEGSNIIPHYKAYYFGTTPTLFVTLDSFLTYSTYVESSGNNYLVDNALFYTVVGAGIPRPDGEQSFWVIFCDNG